MGVIEVGTQIDHYVVEGTLGQGGMGEVYLARDMNLDRKVAIKTLIPGQNTVKLERRFENEAKILASLNHGNIVGVYNYGQFEGVHYMVMELIEGNDLSTILKSRGFGIGECIEAFQQMVEGIHEAHSQGVLHRDIKPANIVVDANGRVKVVDFGISKDFKKEDLNLTEMGKVIGTTNYMAPELFVGQRPSTRSDIFSMGIVLFEMLEGVNPFTAETRYETMDNIRNLKPRLSKEVARIVPPVLEEILYKMLKKNPDQRYQDLAEIKDDLRRIDLSTIPNELMSAKRPEVLILNEHKVRMKLLSQGFATREIGIILSLAARIQEGSRPVSDKTEVIGDEPNQKISLTPEAIEKAISRYRGAQSRLSQSREVNFTKSITNAIQEQIEDWQPKHYAAVAGVAVLGVALVFWSLFSSKNPILTLDAPAPKVPVIDGSEFKFKVTLIDRDSGDIIEDNVRLLRYSENELGEFSSEATNLKTGQRAISSTPRSPFVPSDNYITLAGDWGNQVILGEYDDIFPLQMGKTMIYEAKGKNKWEGSFSYKKFCEVIGKKVVKLKIGKYPTWVVECLTLNSKTGEVQRGEDLGYRRFYYSPAHGDIIKSEAQWELNKRIVIEVKEVIDDSNFKRPTY